jgi:nicotinamidase-related amidase
VEVEKLAVIPAADAALVVNDMINGNYRRSHDDAHNQLIERSGIITATMRLVAGMRAHRIPVFWVRVNRRADRADIAENLVDERTAWHTGAPPISADSEAGSLIEEVTLAPEDHTIIKQRFDPFIGTDLDLQLRSRRRNTLLLCGYSTNMGVESCARTGHDLGYDVVVVKDCVYSIPEDLHTFAIERILPRFARLMTADEVVTALG